MQSSGDAVTFLVVLCLPVLGWVVSRRLVWVHVEPRLRRLGRSLWRQVVVDDAPDPVVLQQWAVERLGRLRADRDRVRRLLLDDDWMSATRQVGNRLAYERLVVDVRAAEAQVADAAAVEAPAAPTPVGAPRVVFVAPQTGRTVEVVEFGPRGRWL